MSANIWDSPENQIRFFERIMAIVEDTPEIMEKLSRAEEEESWESDDGWPPFSKDDPVMVDGLLLVVSLRNTENYGAVMALSPLHQSAATDHGLAHKATRFT